MSAGRLAARIATEQKPMSETPSHLRIKKPPLRHRSYAAINSPDMEDQDFDHLLARYKQAVDATAFTGLPNLTTNEGAPYLAFFWRDVGINECWRESVVCV